MKLAELSQQEINLTFAVDPTRSHLYFHNVKQEVIQRKSTQNTTVGKPLAQVLVMTRKRGMLSYDKL